MKLFLLRSLMVLLLSLLAFLVFLYSFDSYKDVSEIRTWKQISATIVSATTERVQGRKGVAYCPRIMVSFDLGGQHFTSELEVTGHPCSLVRETTRKSVHSYVVGNTYDMYVNPSKPSEVRALTYSLGLAFYVMSIIGVFILILIGIILFPPANKKKS